MNDEILMSVVDAPHTVWKSFRPRGDVQAIRIAVGIDGNAVNVLHDDIGAAIRNAPPSTNARYRMIELREYLALQLQSRMHPNASAPPWTTLMATCCSNWASARSAR